MVGTRKGIIEMSIVFSLVNMQMVERGGSNKAGTNDQWTVPDTLDMGWYRQVPNPRRHLAHIPRRRLRHCAQT